MDFVVVAVAFVAVCTGFLGLYFPRLVEGREYRLGPQFVGDVPKCCDIVVHDFLRREVNDYLRV